MSFPMAAVKVRGKLQEGWWPCCGDGESLERIIALVKRDSLAGLADQIDLLKDKHAMANGIGHALDHKAGLNHYLEVHQ